MRHIPYGLLLLAALPMLHAAPAFSPEDASFTGPAVTVDMAAAQLGTQGLAYWPDHHESDAERVGRAGSAAWRETRMMYFRVEDTRLSNGKAPLVRLDVEYFDEGRSVVVLKYDSSDRYVSPGPDAGVWKTRKLFALGDSRRWKQASIVLQDAKFAKRCNGGDMRLQGQQMIVRRLTITAATEVDQAANLAALAAAPLPLEAATKPLNLTREQVLDKLAPYVGPSHADLPVETLVGQVVAGYQGWFAAPGDGSGMGWVHYNGAAGFRPGDCSIDLWPDTREMDEDELYPTEFRNRDGSVAPVFSSYNAKTVDRHCRWAKEGGINGLMVQRFMGFRNNATTLNKYNTVLMNVRAGANRQGISYAVMYDLSGARDAADDIITDWRSLVDRALITSDPAYQRHNGGPVVVLWGLFADREYCLDAFEQVTAFLKDDPTYGGCTVVLGTANDWRTGTTANHERMRRVIQAADIVSPWTVGRYGNEDQARLFMRTNNVPDQAWCDAHDTEYMPVIFPGFSWHNMHHGLAPLNPIPRRQGRFFWRQAVAAKQTGARMLYVAMFDEVDEGTAIFKCSNTPPVGASPFLDYEGLPSDHYLWLAGQAGRLLNGEIAPTELPPERPGVAIAYRAAEDGTGLPDGETVISVVLADPIETHGMSFQENGEECSNEPVTRNARRGWMSRTLGPDADGRKMYFRADYREFTNGACPRLQLAIDYFDDIEGDVRVVYDSTDERVQVTAHRGAWKEAGSFHAQGSRTWKTATFDIDDALLAQRCNGWDFRLEFSGDLVVGAVRMSRR